eukprot:gene26377-35015_t
MTDKDNDVVKHDNLACEALDSFFFKSTSAEFVADPYSYHAFILSQHKLHSDVPTDDLALPNYPPLSSVFYTEWKNEVDKNILVDSLSQSLPLKLLNKEDGALLEDFDVEDIDLSATTIEPEKQSLFGPNAVKVDNFVDDYDDDDNSHGGEGYIPSGVQLESSLESATDYLLQQFERDLLADGSDDEEFDECRNNNTAEYILNKGKVHDATIHDSSGGDYPEKFDCESSIDSGICTIDCGDSSDQDDNNRDDDEYDGDYQGPSLLSDEQLLASMQSSCGDGDLIRFLTAHGGRLHGLYDRLQAIPHATET